MDKQNNIEKKADTSHGSAGVGADIFIRKNGPGSSIGVGYTVDIFENGVKVDTFQLDKKKMLRDIIQEYKNKYNTMRSFNNESLTHVTYRTKEERGEVPIEQPKVKEKYTKNIEENNGEGNGAFMETGETPKFDKSKNLTTKNKLPGMTQRGETAMDSKNDFLYKKAYKINYLLNKLVDPTMPVTKRADSEVGADSAVGEDNVDFLPETPLPGESDNASNEISEDFVANQMSKKLVEYIQQNSGDPTDTLYNSIKKWMASVKKELNTWERANGKQLNKNEISKKIKSIVSSGDPEKIQSALGVSIDQDNADLLQKVTLMDIGTPPKPKEEGGEDTSLSETLGKAATLDDSIEKILGVVNTAEESDAESTARRAIKALLGENNGMEDIEQIIKEMPDTFNGATVLKALKDMEESQDKSEEVLSDPNTSKILEIKISEFWKYTRKNKLGSTISDAFVDWINTQNMPFIVATALWEKVKTAVFKSMHDKLTSVAQLDIFSGADIIGSITFFIDPRKDMLGENRIIADATSSLESYGLAGKALSDIESFLKNNIKIPSGFNYGDDKEVTNLGEEVSTKLYDSIKSSSKNTIEFTELLVSAARRENKSTLQLEFKVNGALVYKLEFDNRGYTEMPLSDDKDQEPTEINITEEQQDWGTDEDHPES